MPDTKPTVGDDRGRLGLKMARDGAPNFRTSHYWCDENDRQTAQWVPLVLAEQDRQPNANFGSLGVSDSSGFSAQDGAHHILGVASVSMNKEKLLIYFFFSGLRDCPQRKLGQL